VLIIPVGNTRMLLFFENQTERKPKKTAIISKLISVFEYCEY
jgi:hypothetical protein